MDHDGVIPLVPLVVVTLAMCVSAVAIAYLIRRLAGK